MCKFCVTLASIFDLSAHEKLVLLITLVDELLIQPQVRETIEENFDRIRSLRQMLKNQHQYRSKLHNCGLTVSDEQARSLLSTGIAPNISTEEFLNTSVKARVGGSSKKNLLLRPIRVTSATLHPLRCIKLAHQIPHRLINPYRTYSLPKIQPIRFLHIYGRWVLNN
ncbi:hypothetical protein Ciccas_009610 [Cichlidogyrus casuarinus]|uniref:Uncharacterized protein n=1 Tax=Cichlidogyrus casuarinus TaxID=1844966 RepID=A0ABD2PWI5_9PLAT